MYNLLSFLLGLLAWGLGIAAICKPHKRWYSPGSLSSCSISLLMQLMEVLRRVNLQDWTALMDTMDATVTAAKILLFTTLAMNLIALYRDRKA